MTHVYDVLPAELADIKKGTKTFSILKNGKGVSVGDDIIFQSFDEEKGEYDGEEWKGVVSEIKDDSTGHIKKGYVAVIFKEKEA